MENPTPLSTLGYRLSCETDADCREAEGYTCSHKLGDVCIPFAG